MILKTLKEILAEQFNVDEDSITAETSFEDDLGADSVDILEVSLALEEAFDIEEMGEEDLSGIKTVGDLLKFLQDRLDDN